MSFFLIEKKTFQGLILVYSVVSEPSFTVLSTLPASKVPTVLVGNKIDLDKKDTDKYRNYDGILFISAANKIGIEDLKKKILEQVNITSFKTGNTIVTNMRHYESLLKTKEALASVTSGIKKSITSELLAQDIRMALMYLGEITGEITTEDLLGTIFSKFCIGK